MVIAQLFNRLPVAAFLIYDCNPREPLPLALVQDLCCPRRSALKDFNIGI